MEQCDRVQLVFSHCLDIQKQIENLVESVNQQGTDSSSTDTSEDLRYGGWSVLLTLDVCFIELMEITATGSTLRLPVR